MADDETKTGEADRRRVAGGHDYEVGYFARKHAITTEQARELIAWIGMTGLSSVQRRKS
jgi:hypothetical protein